MEKFTKYGICDYDREAHARGDKKGRRNRVGVIAQDVQKAMIEIYGTDSYANIVNDNLYDMNSKPIPEGIESQLGITYSNFIPFLIKAIQELNEKIDTLEAKLNEK